MHRTRAQLRMADLKRSLLITSSFFWSSPVVFDEPANPVSYSEELASLRVKHTSDSDVDECSSSNVVGNALEGELECVAKESTPRSVLFRSEQE